MSSKFTIKLVAPDGVKYEGEADEAILPTKDGQIGVLANHEPLIALVVPGEIILRDGGKEHYIATGGGIAEVANNQLKILSDEAQYADELDSIKINEAKAKAGHALKEAKDEVDFSSASAMLERILASEKVLKRRKYHSR